jgi:hypothetical protein
VHIVTGDAPSAMAAITRMMGDQAIPIDSLERIQPSMEDVFISLIEGVEGTGGEEVAS